jgi:hypothetical protein
MSKGTQMSRISRVALPLILFIGILGVAGPYAAQGQELSVPAASGTAAEAGPSAGCLVHSLPSFVAQGEGTTTATVADVVEVECNPDVYGSQSKVRITASQLFYSCNDSVTWYVPNPYTVVSGPGVTLELDADGNATVALIAGPGCSAGETLISAHTEEEPYETLTVPFTVLPPSETAQGVFALPASEVEDARSSSVATIVEAEFPEAPQQNVRIASEELFDRCRLAPHLHWIRENGSEVLGQGEVGGVGLDDDGNGFVLAIGDSSCAEGPSLIEAGLESVPGTTLTTTFTILPPQPTAEAPVEEPSFTIEKRQSIAGSGAAFTTARLEGTVGETVDYEILVTNTGTQAFALSDFTDPHCDEGTIAGGPGDNSVAPGATTTYTCSHVLGSTGIYINEATVTADPPGSSLTETSNRVEVDAVAKPNILKPVTVAEPTASPSPKLAAMPSSTLKCPASPQLLGASGSKVEPFTVRVSSLGIARISFYLDGRKLETLGQAHAKSHRFTLAIDPRWLSHGAHRLSIRAVMAETGCAPVSRASVFVRPEAKHVAPYTG